MALQKTLSLKNNFQTDSVFSDAYVKIEFLTVTKNNIVANVSIKKSKESSILRVTKHEFAIDLDLANPIKQAYNHLKTLPEFAGATDC